MDLDVRQSICPQGRILFVNGQGVSHQNGVRLSLCHLSPNPNPCRSAPEPEASPPLPVPQGEPDEALAVPKHQLVASRPGVQCLLGATCNDAQQVATCFPAQNVIPALLVR